MTPLPWFMMFVCVLMTLSSLYLYVSLLPVMDFKKASSNLLKTPLNNLPW